MEPDRSGQDVALGGNHRERNVYLYRHTGLQQASSRIALSPEA